MTDKELRKLSRLELLELLLEVSKENESLKEKIEMLKAENKAIQNLENLSAVTHQVENALRYANSLTDALKNKSDAAVPADNKIRENKDNQVESDSLSDREIYRRMLSFFAENDASLSVFPSDVEEVVRARIKSILERRKKN